MNAISYVRFSTPEQIKGTSYQRQIEATEAYCAKHGLTLIDEGKFFDEGVSAFTGENKRTGQLADILERVNSGKIPPGTRLIVENLDRLGRDSLMSQLGTFTGLLNAGIHIVTLGDSPKEYAPGSGLTDFMLALMQMGLAHDESKKKAERLSAAWKIKRENIAKKPLTSVVPYWIQKRGNELFLIPERAAVIQQIFEMAMNGLGRRAIAKSLNEKKVAVFGSTKRNKANLWRDSYIAKILTNRSTFGEFQPHQKHAGKRTPVGEPLADYFPTAISEQTFLAVQARMRGRAGRGGRSIQKAQNLFSSRLKCWHCGGPMHFQNKGSGPKNPNNLKYVVCENRFYANTCAAPIVPYKLTEKTMLAEMTQLDWSALMSPATAHSTSDQIAALSAKVAEYDKKIGRLMAALLDLNTESPTIAARIVSLESEREKAAAALKDLASAAEAKNRTRHMADEAAKEAAKFLHLAEHQETRLTLKKHVGDLLARAYIQWNGECLRVLLIFAEGGVGYVLADSKGIRNSLKFETGEREVKRDKKGRLVENERGRKDASLAASLAVFMSEEDCKNFQAREPQLFEVEDSKALQKK